MRIIKLNGFTMVELMVVVTIMIILSGVSVAAYFRFSQRQAAMNDARNFVTEIKKTQALAKNLVYPAGCSSGLIKYVLKTDCISYGEGCNTMSISGFCGATEYPVIIKEVVLLKTYFSSLLNISFAAGTGTISPTGVYPIQNSGDAYTVVVTTDVNGNISTEEYETYN